MKNLTKRESNLTLVALMLSTSPATWRECATTMIFLVTARCVWRLLRREYKIIDLCDGF